MQVNIPFFGPKYSKWFFLLERYGGRISINWKACK